MLKKILIFVAVLFLGALGVNTCLANQSFVPTESVGVINDFAVTATINQDSSVDITEEITYNFGNYKRHGIYRTIPIKYEIGRTDGEISEDIKETKVLGSKYNLRIKDVSVTDETGSSYNFSKSKDGRYLEIKVGDSDAYVQGIKTYIIKYKVFRAVGFFSDHDELYWNVTGGEWEEPILKSSFQIILPEEVKKDNLKQACYTGASGSTQSMCLGEITDKNKIIFNLEEGYSLNSQEGLTAVLSWPKGIIKPISKSQKYLWILEDNLGALYAFIAPVLAFIFLFSLWFRRGRDPEGKGTIIARYNPPKNMTAQELGTVVDEKVDNVDLSSLIISLAVKGYLKIKELEGKKILGISMKKDYQLEKLKSNYGELKTFEKTFMEKVFGSNDEKKLSELKNKFYRHIPKLKKELYGATVAEGYFSKNPQVVRATYFAIGVAVIFAGTPVVGIFFQSGLATFANVVVGIMIILFGLIMPRKTAKGVKAKEDILGLKEYLSVAEADRIKFHNAPEKKPKTFEKLLPYAMVLSVENEWAKQFEDIYKTPPDWYEGGDLHAFSALYLANSLTSLQNNANAAFASR
ncbi:MAG: DUF2207 domain-containing protein, partial [Patescibacteria group bacterium]|nr:DUF2207 domain-containing protein [Patescibacteria group bacterium]